MEPQYIMHIPSLPLAEYIECLWIVRIPKRDFSREKVLPNGCIELIFNLGGPFNVLDQDDERKKSHVKKSWISGQHKRFITIEQLGHSDMVGIRFKPGGAYPFLQFPVSELSGYVLETDLIWGPIVEEIRERLAEAKGTRETFAFLEGFLLARLAGSLDENKRIRFAAHRLLDLAEEVSVRTLSDEHGVSHKQLIQQFNKHIGLPPKTLLRIHKFQKALHLMDQQKTSFQWTDIIEPCGYFDQAHFIRDFKAFSGLTPTRYLIERGVDKNFVPVHT